MATVTVSATDGGHRPGRDPGPVLGVVGWSGSGKTSLLEYLIGRLAAQGLRVNVVKHSHHDIELEPPRKDSARLRLAGAAEVMIASPYRVAILRELRGAAEPSLAQHLARLAPADLTLVEGYKWERIPKLEVFRPALGKPALHPADPDIVAVASDGARPQGEGGPAWFDLNEPDSVLAWLEKWMRDRPKVFAAAAVKGGHASMGE